MAEKNLLPQVTRETIIAAAESYDINDGATLFSRWLSRVTEENPLLAHQIAGWCEMMLRKYGTVRPEELLSGPLVVYALLSAQAESDSISLEKK